MALGEAKGTAQHARYVGAGWLLVIEKVQKKRKKSKKGR